MFLIELCEKPYFLKFMLQKIVSSPQFNGEGVEIFGPKNGEGSRIFAGGFLGKNQFFGQVF